MSLTSALRALEHSRARAEDVCFIVYDNSPVAQCPPQHDTYALRYVHDSSNRGLTAAYNHALSEAYAAGAPWLLLLDQDSTLPLDYFEHFEHAKQWCETRTAAIVPFAKNGERVISPQLVVLGVGGLVAAPRSGLWNHELTAINSGAFARVSYLQKVGGYAKDFRLDAVDSMFFAGIYSAGANVYVMSVSIEHDLSLLTPQNISPARWQSIVGAEVDYYLRTRGLATRLLQAGAMSLRALRAVSRREWVQARTLAREQRRLLFGGVRDA